MGLHAIIRLPGFFPLASTPDPGYHLICLPIAAHPGAGTRADGREFHIESVGLEPGAR